MKVAFAIPFAIVLTSLINSPAPASAQWNDYTPYQQRQMRRNGWSSGDYFGESQIRQQRRPSNYQPGLDRNIRYRSNDCAIYVNC